MRCNKVKKNLMLLIDRPEDIKPDVAAHLQACSGCRQEFALLQRLSKSLRSLEAPQAPAHFSAGVMARIAAEGRMESRGRFGWVSSWKRLAVAAATVIMMAGSAFGIIRFAGVTQPPMVAGNPKPPVVQPGTTQGTKPPSNPVTATETPGYQPGNNTVSPEHTTQAQPTGDNPGSETQPAADGQETQPPKHSDNTVEIAAARSPRVFLSETRILSSTVLRVEVKNLAGARAEALSAARGFDASGGISVANSSDGQKRTEMYQFIAPPEKAEDLVTALGGLGMITSRQDEQRDITNDFNNAQTQYLDLIASRNADPEGTAKIDAEIDGLEKYLSRLEAATGKRTVTLWLVEIP
ncbi:MAG: hypothetical protein AB1500_08205 [Bacillota bacterium]